MLKRSFSNTVSIGIISFLSIFLCLFGAYLYNRYSTPIYSASTTVLIRDDSNASLGAENLLEGLELFSGKKI